MSEYDAVLAISCSMWFIVWSRRQNCGGPREPGSSGGGGVNGGAVTSEALQEFSGQGLSTGKKDPDFYLKLHFPLRIRSSYKQIKLQLQTITQFHAKHTKQLHNSKCLTRTPPPSSRTSTLPLEQFNQLLEA